MRRPLHLLSAVINQSPTHDRLVDLLSNAPGLICQLWSATTGQELPDGVARTRAISVRSRMLDGKSRFLQVDALIMLHPRDDPEGEALFALIVEVQLEPNADKLYTWVEYLAAVRRRYECPARVLVFSHRAHVLDWAKALFAKEPHLCPDLFGRDQIPVIDDTGTAIRNPEHAVLAAVFHADSERVVEYVEHAVIAASTLPAWRRKEYIALLRDTISEDIMDDVLERLAREAIEEADAEMKRAGPWRKGHRAGVAEGIERGIEQGRLAALRDALWLLVELRELVVTPAERERVEACRDPDQLHRWMVRLKTVEAFADALAD